MPESPYYMSHTSHKMENSMDDIESPNSTENSEISNAETTVHVNDGHLWHEIGQNRQFRWRLLLSMGIAVCQTITAASAVLYYSKNIIQNGAHVSGDLAEIGLTLAKLAGSMSTLWLVDRVGRRPLLLFGMFI